MPASYIGWDVGHMLGHMLGHMSHHHTHMLWTFDWTCDHHRHYTLHMHALYAWFSNEQKTNNRGVFVCLCVCLSVCVSVCMRLADLKLPHVRLVCAPYVYECFFYQRQYV